MALDPDRLSPEARALYTRIAEEYDDPYKFLTRSCYTYDEVDTDAPIKLLPEKPHIEQIVRAWQSERLLCIPKSRRMQATWTVVGLDLWSALFIDYSTVFIVSNDQAKSDRLVARALWFYEHLPWGAVRPRMDRPRYGKGGDPTQLFFPESHSTIRGLSQNPDVLRQEAATLLHLEEFTSWEWPEEAWSAMLPTLQGSAGAAGGKMVVVSSAKAGTLFQRIVMDDLGEVVQMG